MLVQASTIPLPSQRSLFDVPCDVAYFNCAYNSPQLNVARDRLLASVSSKSHPWERTTGDFFADAVWPRHARGISRRKFCEWVMKGRDVREWLDAAARFIAVIRARGVRCR